MFNLEVYEIQFFLLLCRRLFNTFNLIMERFATIDFETANWERTSVCSVGVVWVEKGMITDKFYSLIHPTPNYYSYRNTQVHGLTREDTDDEPAFPTVWREIAPMLKGIPLVAHNSVFDEGCLKAVHSLYEMPYPDYKFYCTYRLARKWFKGLTNYQLHTVSAHCGYHLENHHHALSDAEAATVIMQAILKQCTDL